MVEERPFRLLVTGGGTGGHTYPALTSPGNVRWVACGEAGARSPVCSDLPGDSRQSATKGTTARACHAHASGVDVAGFAGDDLGEGGVQGVQGLNEVEVAGRLGVGRHRDAQEPIIVTRSRLLSRGAALRLCGRAAVQGVLARTVNPENPGEVDVSNPSDALAARADAAGAFTNLLLGLGAVALLVGGVGVANTMVVSVLERRREIGLCRSLGATRGQVRTQFLTESLLLSALGGLAGAVLGAAATAGFAAYKGWPTVVPLWALAGAIGATLLIGTVAGIYPAMRAARLSATVALAVS